MKNDPPCSRLKYMSVNQITSGPRTVAQTRTIREANLKSDTMPGQVSRNELDTRADTICAGNNFLCIQTTGLVCSVQGFHDSFAPIHQIPVATVATAWDSPDTGETFINIHIVDPSSIILWKPIESFID